MDEQNKHSLEDKGALVQAPVNKQAPAHFTANRHVLPTSFGTVQMKTKFCKPLHTGLYTQTHKNHSQQNSKGNFDRSRKC